MSWAKKERKKKVTYLHKFRCENCRLHFIVCSWYKEIAPVYCPECGLKGRNVYWVEEVNQPLYEFVPGQCPPFGYQREMNKHGRSGILIKSREIVNHIRSVFNRSV